GARDQGIPLDYNNRLLTIDKNIAAWLGIDQLEVLYLIRKAIEIEQESSKNSESKVRQEILLEIECRTENYRTKKIKNSSKTIEDIFIEKNSHPSEIINKGSNQAPEKVKEHKTLREDTN
ncbi:23613_t:CDS:2, partial [Gigaspora margarita]